MIITLSPAKSLNFENTENLQEFSDIFSRPNYTNQSQVLIEEMQKYSFEDIQKLMKVSENIAGLNAERFEKWDAKLFEQAMLEKNYSSAKPAIFAFTGDVYKGLEIEQYTHENLVFADSHFKILSGLYGMISPLSLIQPYRLEMGTRLAFANNEIEYKNLYEYWRETLTADLNASLKNDRSHQWLNLASVEYSKVIDRKKIIGEIIDVDFLVEKNGVLKNIGIFAKQQRGQLSNWIILNSITVVEQCFEYESSGFAFDLNLSSAKKLVFIRREVL